MGLGGLGLITTKIANIYISTSVYWQVCLFLWKYIIAFVIETSKNLFPIQVVLFISTIEKTIIYWRNSFY